MFSAGHLRPTQLDLNEHAMATTDTMAPNRHW